MMLYTPQGPRPQSQVAMHPLNALRNRAIAAAQTEVLRQTVTTHQCTYARVYRQAGAT